jgi:hypothetical protein
VATGAVEVPLYLGSYCIGERSGPCLELLPPSVESLPPVHVRPGDVLTFRIGFAPKGVTLLVLRANGDVAAQATLAPAQSTTWRVPDDFTAPQPGLLATLTAFGAIESATYYARLVT